MQTRGRPGHGSQPHRDNSVLKLAEAIQRIGAAEFQHHATATVRLFIEGVAAKVGKPYDRDLLALLDAKKYRAAMERLPLDEGLQTMFNAMLHNTVTPTMLNAGTKVNVIPSVAEAKCDARLLPGQTSHDLLHELRAVIGKDVEIDFLDHSSAIESDHASPLFDAISRVMARHEPKSPVLPYMVVGATDARHVKKLGTKVYGFSPMFAPTSELDRVHAHDERISIDNLAFGTQVLYEVVKEFCAKP
jgi:acetylornithine deacetylase/succinyl-diaminopimelate desuccinylase-like protein